MCEVRLPAILTWLPRPIVVVPLADVVCWNNLDTHYCMPHLSVSILSRCRLPDIYIFITVLDEVRVDTLKSSPGSRHRHKRKGRGIAAGQGASCGFGMRGQKSRSGPGVRAGFEGGQTALYRRLPKLVGRPMGPGHTKKVSALCPRLETISSIPRFSKIFTEWKEPVATRHMISHLQPRCAFCDISKT